MVRGQSWRALSGVAGTRRLLVDMKDAKRPVRAKRMNVHVSNRIFRPDDVTKRQSGWLREILGPEGCHRTCFKTVTKRSNAKKNKRSGAKTCKLAGSVVGTGAGTGGRGRCAELGGFGRGNLNLIVFRGINAPLFGGSYGRSWHSHIGRYW